MVWIGCICCEKSRRDFVARTFALIAPVQCVLHYLHLYSMFCKKFHAVTKRSQMHPNNTKSTETFVQSPMGWVHWLRKITTRLRGTNFYINCTSSVCFATSFKQLRNDPKCTQMLQNAPKHWNRV